jgi:hypothetical protein
MNRQLNDGEDGDEDRQADLRHRFEAAMRARRAARARSRASGDLADELEPFDFRPFLSLKCGAKGKRTGKPCPQLGIFSNGRCRWHGGLSTGPKTNAGKLRSAQNGARRKSSSVDTVGTAANAGPMLRPAGGVHCGETLASQALACSPQEDAPLRLRVPIGCGPAPQATCPSGLPMTQVLQCLRTASRWGVTASMVAAQLGLAVGEVEAALVLLERWGPCTSPKGLTHIQRSELVPGG